MTRPAMIFAMLLTGCIDTTVEATTVTLSVAGTDARAPFEGRGGATIALERADVAFGPLYLCAGFSAGELCDEALAEWRDARVVDALDPAPVEAGAMNAITGTARSYMYDHGIVSLLTQDAPLETPAATSLGGASVIVEGRADVDGQTVPFTVTARLEQSGDVSQGVPVVRSGETDTVAIELRPDGGTALLVRFDPRPWLATASFDGLVEDAACAPGVAVACAGSVEQTCDADGAVLATSDCALLGQPCLRGVGCAERAVLDADDQVGRALRAGLEAGARPLFEVTQR